MSRYSATEALVLAALVTLPPAQAQSPPPAAPTPPPIEVPAEERVDVRLVLIDAVVVDRDGRTVADLTRDDFDLVVDGKEQAIGSVDLSCAAGATADPRAVNDPARRTPSADGTGRHIVLALDYLHLPQTQRVEVLEAAKRMVRHGLPPGEEIMVAALNGGLRVEQGFTADRERVIAALQRMEYDISLWGGTFAHVTEAPFFAGLQTLFEVLNAVPGSKAVVLFSNNTAPGMENNPAFAALAATASASRCSVYPVHAAGLVPPTPGQVGERSGPAAAPG